MNAPAENVTLDLNGIRLEGMLTLPAHARGLVLFVHGSGSGRLSPRNRRVAQLPNRRALGTLVFDLLTAAEQELDETSGELRFDIDLLSRRTIQSLDWVSGREQLAQLPVGLFGASTGAAAALVAAAARPAHVDAVVSRGGRPDLALRALPGVRAPTLLIVGGRDHAVIDLNRHAAAAMKAPHRLDIIDGATHLFQEEGKLELVAALAAEWFLEYLPGRKESAESNGKRCARPPAPLDQEKHP
jgi:dienelactone hydrolase